MSVTCVAAVVGGGVGGGGVGDGGGGVGGGEGLNKAKFELYCCQQADQQRESLCL